MDRLTSESDRHLAAADAIAGWKVTSTSVARAVQERSSRAWAVLRATGPFRFVSASLARRIFISNLLGLVVLVGGVLWLSQHQALLISAKVESLKIQGEIIAAAIASNASIDTDRLAFEQDRLPEADGRRMLHRDDGFAAMELSLRPDRVGPVLRRLILPAHNTRARIYTREGTRIFDSSEMVGSAMIVSDAQAPPEKVRVKNFWTRLSSWFDGSDLPVYREIGAANGTYYPEVRQALRGVTLPPMLLLTDESKQIVSHAVPIQRRNAILGVLLLSTRPGEIDEILGKERRLMVVLSLIAIFATVMTSFLLARTIAGPMGRLSMAAEQVSQSLTARADLPQFTDRKDEVGQMAGAFRRMTAALYRRIEASEKFAADVAHELKNPLAAARGTADVLAFAKSDQEREHLVDQLQGELRRLNRLITDVSNASRLDAELARQRTAPIDLRTVLSGVVDVFGELFASDARRLDLDVAGLPEGSSTYVVMAHEGRMGQVATNLIDNALSFSPANAMVTVRLRRLGSEIEFAIEDEGPGIAADRLEAIFERFYSDRPQSDQTKGKNSGLGLSISREIVTAYGGRMWAENRALDLAVGVVGGARFIVRLPAAHTSAKGHPGLGWRY